MKQNKRLWWGLAILIFLSPVGLILPEVFKSGPAWGEWSLGEIEKMVGFIPEGLRKLADLWPAPLPEYNVASWEGKGLFHSSLGYILSGFLGVAAVVGVTLLVGKILGKKDSP
jgi:hypothetical protein